MKNENGVTLVALVTTIILIFIIASVATSTSLTSYKLMKVQNFVAKMQVIQEKVNNTMEEYENWKVQMYNKPDEDKTMQKYYTDTLKFSPASSCAYVSDFNKIIDLLKADSTIKSWQLSDENIANYYYFSPDDLKTKLGLKDMSDMYVIINFATGNVIEKTGVQDPDDNEKRIYRQYDHASGTQLTEFEETTTTSPDISISVKENNGTDKKISVSTSNSNIWKVYYKIDDDTEWKDASSISDYEIKNSSKEAIFTINVSGKYKFKLLNSYKKESEEKELKVTLCNPPVLVEGMKPVKWNGTTVLETNQSDVSWYDYDEDKKVWANAQTKDGSYWVWIPRYEYKLTAPEASQNKGTIDIKFVDGVSETSLDGKASSDYSVLPCFKNGTTNSFSNGEWDKELTGIWVAKYDASRTDATSISKGSNQAFKFVPSVLIANDISPLVAFKSAKEIKTNVFESQVITSNKDLDTHLIKNSEWAAIAYLTYSKYGRKGEEPLANTTLNYPAGGSTSTTDVYDSSYVKETTTNNAYGIYDLVGGASTIVASGLNQNKFEGSSITTSTKYATIYSENFSASLTADALKEVTITSGSENKSWFDKTANYFNNTSTPKLTILTRGGAGNISGKGLFYYSAINEDDSSQNGFRAVMVSK